MPLPHAESKPQPRLWVVDVGSLAIAGDPQVPPAPQPLRAHPQERLGAWSGMGLALAHLLRSLPRPVGLVLAAGDAVRRGLPTAARLTVLGPSPLLGGLGEGLVGSDLARRLAAVCDVLALEGRVLGGGGVLVVEPAGVRLVQCPEWVTLAPEERWDAAQSSFGPCALLRTGPGGAAPAGERDGPVAFANLAAGSAPASFVGRGLGAALGAHGLLGIAVTAQPKEPEPAPHLDALLLRSPRLAARAEGGTLELGDAFAARGQLLDGSEAQELVTGAERARTARHGCKGCPTPCGWVFESPGGDASGARFSAVQALGGPLGLGGFDGPGALLARCNQLGLDAKEVGAGLALLIEAGESGLVAGAPERGDLPGLLAALDDLVAGNGPAAVLAEGSARAAKHWGIDSPESGGEAVRDSGEIAALLGACAGVRGAEPMRTFPFLLEGGAGAEQLTRLMHPWSIPKGTADPDLPIGTGRAVVWHEDFVAGVDLTGFCAFSAAGLLADGACDLDELALAIAPESIAQDAALGRTPGQRLLTAGASLLAGLRLLHQGLGVAPKPIPGWAQPRLEQPGVLGEYRDLRRLDARGELLPGTAELLGLADLRRSPEPSGAESTEKGEASPKGARAGEDPARARAPGQVTLRASGALGRRLGSPRVLACPLPCPMGELLALVAVAAPGAAPWLLRGDLVLPAVWRAGKLVSATEPVSDGDVLDLVVAVSGG